MAPKKKWNIIITSYFSNSKGKIAHSKNFQFFHDEEQSAAAFQLFIILIVAEFSHVHMDSREKLLFLNSALSHTDSANLSAWLGCMVFGSAEETEKFNKMTDKDANTKTNFA